MMQAIDLVRLGSIISLLLRSERGLRFMTMPPPVSRSCRLHRPLHLALVVRLKSMVQFASIDLAARVRARVLGFVRLFPRRRCRARFIIHMVQPLVGVASLHACRVG